MLAAMDAQANRICKQLEKLDTIGGGGGGGGGGSGDDKREKRRSLRGDIVPMLEELGTLLAEMKAIKEQLAKSQNVGKHVQHFSD
jgi:50S ribosomal subunit-associated GTPase HflX